MRILECPLPPAKPPSGTLSLKLHPSQLRHVKTDLQHILYVACVLKPMESVFCEYPFSCHWSRPPSSVCRPPRPGRPQQGPPQAWLQDPDRPSIVSATELKELDNLDTDADEGWAGRH